MPGVDQPRPGRAYDGGAMAINDSRAPLPPPESHPLTPDRWDDLEALFGQRDHALSLRLTRDSVINATAVMMIAAASSVRGASGSPASAQPSSMATTGLT